MKINWGIRRKNRLFMLAMLGAAFLVGKLVLSFFRPTLSHALVSRPLTYFFDVISLILIVLGIVIDPTTRGVSDSKRAQKYVTFGQQYDYNDLDQEGTWKID